MVVSIVEMQQSTQKKNLLKQLAKFTEISMIIH